MLLVCLLGLPLHFGEKVTLRLVLDILRGASSATRAGHGVTCMGLPGHLDSPGPDSEVRALRLPEPATGSGAGAVIVAISAGVRVQSQTADTRHLKPDSTPLQKKIKTICEPKPSG